MPVPKDENEKVKLLIAGYELVLNYSRMIAMFPIDEWLQGLEHAETVTPIIDPTLYREYIYSKKGEILKKVLRSALELKRTIEEIQPDVRKEMEKVKKGKK